MTQSLPLLRPLPQRTFEISAPSNEPSSPSSPLNDSYDPYSFDDTANGDEAPGRTRSILNLTSSTLYGIYSRGDIGGPREDINTPWGTGAATPQSPQTSSHRASLDDKRPPVIGAFEHPRNQNISAHHYSLGRGAILPVVLKTILLFGFGMAYGEIVTHLHDDQQLAPVKVEGIERYSWPYLLFWGVIGVALGSLLPWIDSFWEETLGEFAKSDSSETPKPNSRFANRLNEEERPFQAESGMGADWNPVVRSIGAFVGIAFAIVRPSKSCF